MEEAAGKVNGGKVSAEEFTAAMAEDMRSLDSKFSKLTFQNRMINEARFSRSRLLVYE